VTVTSLDPNALTLLTDLIADTRKAGADTVDAVYYSSQSETVSCRLGKLEDVERSENCDLGLRAFVGQRQAIISTTDIRPATLKTLAARVVDMARAAPEEPFAGLADQKLLAHSPWAELDLFDPFEPDANLLKKRALLTEEAARAVTGVSNSEGAGASWSTSHISLATSNGFAGGYRGSSHSFSVSVLAGPPTAMERDYDFSSARHAADLEKPDIVGRRAGERAVRRLKARKVKTCEVPVIFDPRVAASLLGHLAGAINGHAIARGTSFLKDKLEKQVFASGVKIIDDPHRIRGLRSKPFDGEGVANAALDIISDGCLRTWLLDTSSARQLKLTSNGRASRGTGSPPGAGITNLYMLPGEKTPDELMADIDSGFYITELIGMGVNGITGDYSRGAAGFWIEKGKIAYPVNEVTIASNLIRMFAGLTPANDLNFRYGTDAPTLRIDRMTVAGN
jgi:PmbA protein